VKPKPAQIRIGYWEIRGLAAALRMMCEYSNVPYINEAYTVTGSPGKWDRSAWLNKKPALKAKNALMNLPYVVDGDTVVTQSNACLTYLGRKFGLNGANDTELIRVEQVLAQCTDLRNCIVDAAYSGKMEEVCKVARESYRGHYEKFEEFMSQNQTGFSASNSPTTGDFHLFELLDQVERMCKQCGAPSALADFPILTAIHTSFSSMERLAGYRASAPSQYPINNPSAVFR